MLELNKVYNMDCIEGMKLLPDNSIDSIVTDPPYEIGFMGKWWDSTGIANNVDMRKECLRVLKPWWHLLSFAATRTYHRMTCAIEDAGFEVRDMIEWVYGSGFPKSLNIGKAVDKLEGNEREETDYIAPDGKKRWGGNSFSVGEEPNGRGINKATKWTSPREWRGTAMKPAHEPICMARKPLGEKTIVENVLKYGTGGINIDESRVEASKDDPNHREIANKTTLGTTFGSKDEIKSVSTGTSQLGELGRFPANLIHDNSEEVRECFPDSKGGAFPKTHGSSGFVSPEEKQSRVEMNDSGNASRFFKSIIYQAKASKSERNNGCEEIDAQVRIRQGLAGEKKDTISSNFHPTVKPIALMEYLIKMVTKEWWTVLDPFTWSWTTLVAAKRNLYNYIWFELSKEYCDIIEARLKSVQVWLF